MASLNTSKSNRSRKEKMTVEEPKKTWPHRKPLRLPPDAYRKEGVWYFLTICCKKKENYFEEHSVRELVALELRQTALRNQIAIAAYTILPNHIHLICSTGTKGVIPFVKEFKSRVAVQIRKRFGVLSPWQRSFFDHKIRSAESLRQKCEYIWMNPVKRGLARRPDNYPWSGVVFP